MGGQVLGAATQSKYQYTGQEKDDETGLNYYGARFYDSELRRFTQPDSIIQDVYNPQSLNRYSYAFNNPLKYIDPSGHLNILNYNNALTKYYNNPGAKTYNNVLNVANSIRNEHTKLTNIPAQAPRRSSSNSSGSNNSARGGSAKEQQQVSGAKSEPPAKPADFIKAAANFNLNDIRSGGICVNANGGLGAFSSGGFCGVATSKGEIAFMPTSGWGGSSGLVTGLAIGTMVSTAKDVDELTGENVSIGASYWVIQGDYSASKNDPSIQSLFVGGSLPLPDISPFGAGEINTGSSFTYPLFYGRL